MPKRGREGVKKTRQVQSHGGLGDLDMLVSKAGMELKKAPLEVVDDDSLGTPLTAEMSKDRATDAAEPPVTQEVLSIKERLAEEFEELGDQQGADELREEVRALKAQGKTWDPKTDKWVYKIAEPSSNTLPAEAASTMSQEDRLAAEWTAALAENNPPDFSDTLASPREEDTAGQAPIPPNPEAETKSASAELLDEIDSLLRVRPPDETWSWSELTEYDNKLNRASHALFNWMLNNKQFSAAASVNRDLYVALKKPSVKISRLRNKQISDIESRRLENPSLTDEQLSQEFNVPVADILVRGKIWREERERAARRLQQAEPPTATSATADILDLPDLSVQPEQPLLAEEPVADGRMLPPESRTRAEWKEKLKNLILRPEKNEDVQRRSEYLANRSAALNAGAKLKYGEVAEEHLHRIGEKYNRLRLPWKVALGLGMSTGAVAFACVSGPLAAVFGGGLVGQRVLGGLSSYIMIEKFIRTKEYEGEKLDGVGKAVAALGAITYSLLGSVAVAEGVHLLSESSVGEVMREFVKQHWPFAHSTGAAEVDQTLKAPAAQPAPAASAAGAAQPAPAASEAVVPKGSADPMDELRKKLAEKLVAPPSGAAAPELPSIEASKGHGYEYMMKRMWEQLGEKHLDPSKFAEGSDIRRLLEANASSIDKVVHQIAADPSHAFFNTDGTSVRIDASAEMSINADGQIYITDAAHPEGIVAAPEGAPVTDYSPEHKPYDWETAPAHEVPTSPEGGGLSGTPDSTLDTAPAPVEVRDTLADASVIPREEGEVFKVATGTSHIYASSGAAIFAFGGTRSSRLEMTTKYLKAHPDNAVIGEDPTGKYRVEWRLANGKLQAGEPLRTRGFLGLFSQLLPPPRPEEFKKIIN